MTKPKILLVDDVNLMLELEKSFLRFSPVRIFTASNGEEALEVIRTERPHLVYLDLNMPKMDGVACCAAIKADPEICSTPVIMVTTAGRPEEEETSRRAGCAACITKPLDRRLFLELGRRYIPNIDRREPRVAYSIPVNCRQGAGEMKGVTADISIGGLFMAVDRTPSQEQSIELSFSIPGGGQIKARGRVAWLNGSGSRVKPQLPVGFGVEFVEINPDDLDRIKGFLESLRPE